MTRNRSCATLIICLGVELAGTAFVQAGDLFVFPFTKLERKKPPTERDTPVERLAKEIDWLEHYIDEYGTVVPKQPDIWGQARLTAHRQEIDTELKKEMTEFSETLQASIQRSDGAFVGMAMALNAAASGGAASTPTDSATVMGWIKPGENNALPSGTVTYQPEFVSSKKGDKKTLQLSIEPTERLAQEARYLNYLAQLRRTNEGDDTSDAPGYALHLVRIPISILPGQKTQRGFGAEIAVTVEPQITEELLPNTFRNLVVNDIVEMLALPLTKVIHENWTNDGFWESLNAYLEVESSGMLGEDGVISGRAPSRTQLDRDTGGVRVRANVHADADAELRASKKTDAGSHAKGAIAASPSGDAIKSLSRSTKRTIRKVVGGRAESPRAEGASPGQASAPPAGIRVSELDISPEEIQKFVSRVKETLPKVLLAECIGPMTAPSSRRTRLPLSPTQLPEIAGSDVAFWSPLLLTTYKSLKNSYPQREQIHLPDVQAVLYAETQSAYECLSLSEALPLWNHCSPDLLRVIRARAIGNKEASDSASAACGPDSISTFRARFREDVAIHLGLNRGAATSHPMSDVRSTPTESLAWAIVVGSALLNDRLIKDIQSVSREKGEHNPAEDREWLPFYLPRPPANNGCLPETAACLYQDWPQSCAAFAQYVHCRWPVIVFALDPMIEEQNVADIYRGRREMQVALAVAVAGGQVSPSAAMRFTRQLETNVDTIALNRTIVGFTHGADTFGWRFYPRVQTPPSQGNLKAFYQSVAGGPTSHELLHQRRLEPGLRECVALVIMPSFVPNVRFESRANWFSLTNPARKEMGLHDAMKISRSFQSVKRFADQLCESAAYRDGDVHRMTRAVQQIDRKLPMQTLRAQVPFENTLGGIELFSNGLSDLQPVLYGWYGEPGVRVSGTASTTVFLVGKNFSVTQTRVVAGGRYIDPVLVSRQVARIDIPADAETYLSNGEPMVDVHMATPYGVSSHLAIPARPLPEPQPPAKKAAFSWKNPGPFVLWMGAVASHDDPQRVVPAAQFNPAQRPDDVLTISIGELTPLFPDAGQIVVRLLEVRKGAVTRLIADCPAIDVARVRKELNTAEKKAKDAKDKAKDRDIVKAIENLLAQGLDLADLPDEVHCEAYLAFDQWPVVKVGDAMVIKVTAFPQITRLPACGAVESPPEIVPKPRGATPSP